MISIKQNEIINGSQPLLCKLNIKCINFLSFERIPVMESSRKRGNTPAFAGSPVLT